jgi:hypothetical protein
LTGEWNDRIVAVIVETEASLPQKHLIAQGFPPDSRAVSGLNPHVSVLNFHAAKADAVRLNHALNRVIAFDETGGADRGDRKYRTEGWEFILAGGAVYDHLDFSFTPEHEDGMAVPLPPGTPGGGGPELRQQLRILKEFIEGFDFPRMAPAHETIKVRSVPVRAYRGTGIPSASLSGQALPVVQNHGQDGDPQRGLSRLGTHAHATETPHGVTTNAADKIAVWVLAEAGRAYAVYVRGGTAAELSLELPAGAYSAEWVNPRTGRVEKVETFRHEGGDRTLASPVYAEDIALRVKRQGDTGR